MVFNETGELSERDRLRLKGSQGNPQSDEYIAVLQRSGDILLPIVFETLIFPES